MADQIEKIRDGTNRLLELIQEVKRETESLKVENDRLRKMNHEAEVVRRVLKWVLAKNVVVARNADQQMYLRDFHTGRPAAIPDVYQQTLFAVVREVELEAEHAG